jgi:branched-chain amino acid transport system ATP-binding protein
MMACTDRLRHDHEGVGEAAEVATGIAVTLVQGRPVPAEDLRALVEYAEGFIEQVHHRREEEVLFPIVATRLPHLAAEVERLKRDHVRGRELIEAVSSTRGDLVRQGDLLSKWSRLVRAHTREEERFLLPIVERTLSSEACLRVKTGLARMDRPGRERVIEPLLGRYSVGG